MTFYTVTPNHFNLSTYAESWNVCDSRGRETGCKIRTFIVEWEVKPHEWLSGWTLEQAEANRDKYAAKGSYGLRVQATRNNESYGAVQPNRYFKTIEERQAAIDKYITDAHKRAIKASEKRKAA